MQLINTGHPFDLEFVTADRRRGTGGEMIKVEKWRKVVKEVASKGLPVTSDQQPATDAATSDSKTKNPNHWEHDTFNIFNPGNRSAYPCKVHYWLMLSYNGKTIING